VIREFLDRIERLTRPGAYEIPSKELAEELWWINWQRKKEEKKDG
jgi:hypothetical protein